MTKTWKATVTKVRPNTGTQYESYITGIKADTQDAALAEARRIAPKAIAWTVTRQGN